MSSNIGNPATIAGAPERANGAGLDRLRPVPPGRTVQQDRVSSQARLHPRARGTGRRRPTSIYLLWLAVIVVIGAFLTSLISLALHGPNVGDDASLGGPALAAGIVGISAAVAGQVLGFVAAVRSENT